LVLRTYSLLRRRSPTDHVVVTITSTIGAGETVTVVTAVACATVATIEDVAVGIGDTSVV